MNKTRKLITGIAAAFAGAALAIPATAEMTVSGSFTQNVASGKYVGGSAAGDKLHLHSNAEIHFTGTGRTDGGLEVQARVELDADAPSDIIDEQWISVAGNFGKVTLGNNDTAALEHGYVGIAGGYGDISYYDGTDTFTPVTIGPGGYNDAQSIRYSTPSIGGFSAGVSYHPEGTATNNPSDVNAKTGVYDNNSITSFGGSYTSEMGSVSITVGGGIVDQDSANDNWGIGTNLGFGATTVYLRMDNFDDAVQLLNDQGVGTGVYTDATNIGVAVERQVGATTFGIGYSERSPDKIKGKATSIVVGAKHQLGGGVSAGLAVAWGEIDDKGYILSGNTDVDATSVGAHIAFSF